MEISKNTGFEPFVCDSGISSDIWKNGNHVYKVTKRNSVSRLQSDYKEMREMLQGLGFEWKLQESEIFSCEISWELATCVKQEIIDGKTIASIDRQEFISYLKDNPEELKFLKGIIGCFHNRIQSRQLYPDLVGNPKDQSLWNSINLMIDKNRGIVVCDIGLSPHEVTLERYWVNFFDSPNVIHYREKMTEALHFLDSL